MPITKIEERTLYPPLVNYLKSIGFTAIGESKIVRKSPDIVFQFDSISFVIEVKIGKTEIGLKAVAQASDYARKLNTQNIIILVYPEKYRNEPITDDNVVEKIALDVEIYALVLTEYWTESLVIKPLNLFKKLKQQIITKEVKVDFKTTVELIGRYVKDLNHIIYREFRDELISEVVNKLDLFSSIGNIKNKEIAKNQVINLASYLLFNQLLFYHIYKKKTQKSSLPNLEQITTIKDIQNYFTSITKIDYQSIYRVNILGHIPNKKIVIDILNEVIKAINLLRAEHITHDLVGRFFHELIPYEVRKVLAAFYTHPNAADLLAGLTIDSYDETIIDPACGSGTLLVAAYRRKQDLYQKLYGFRDNMKMHRDFIESAISGIDIMPFAAHISAINLTMQNIEQETNIVRIATLDSLEMVDSLKSLKFKIKGIEISPYSTSIQLSLDEVYGKPIVIEKKGAISAIGKGSEFYLKPVDVVIMNPPFSQREKMPKEMRENLKKNSLGEICGHRVNLWGYFLVLADLILKPKGKIGAVIPINIARGKATEKIRNYLLVNYHIKHIVKTVKDLAFSEGSAFRDILFIAEKKKPLKKDYTKIWFIKKSIKEMNQDDINEILSNVENQNQEIRKNFSSYIIQQSDLTESFMRSIALSNLERNILLNQAYEKISQIGKLRNITNNDLKEGFGFRPSGISKVIVIARPISEERLSRSELILENEKEKKVIVSIKSLLKKVEIDKKNIVPSFRSLTGISTLDVSEKSDYIVTSPYISSDILMKTYMKKKIDWNYIKEYINRLKGCFCIIPDKLNLSSPNTHLISVFSKNIIIPSNMFYLFFTNNEKEAKIYTLFFNSVASLIQFILNKPETLGAYLRLKMSDWNEVYIPNLDLFNQKDINILLNLFEQLKDIEFPSILDQLEQRFEPRVKMDKLFLEILGFSKKEINEWLPKMYDALIEELKIMKKVK